MKRIIVLALGLALGLALAPLAGAQLYKYVDKDGKTVYTDQPPASADSKQVRVQTAPADAPKSAVQRDKELQKGRDTKREEAKKAEDADKERARKEANCNVARQQFQHYQDGGKIYKYNAAGERELMSDDDIEAARVRSKRELDEACKP